MGCNAVWQIFKLCSCKQRHSDSLYCLSGLLLKQKQTQHYDTSITDINFSFGDPTPPPPTLLEVQSTQPQHHSESESQTNSTVTHSLTN